MHVDKLPVVLICCVSLLLSTCCFDILLVWTGLNFDNCIISLKGLENDNAVANFALFSRWRRSEMRTWWWVDCRSLTKDDTLLRSATWLLIFSTKYHALQFVIVPMRCLNYASEYTLDRVQQVSQTVVRHFSTVLVRNSGSKIPEFTYFCHVHNKNSIWNNKLTTLWLVTQ